MLEPEEIHINGNSMYPAIKDQDILKIDYFEEPKNLTEFKEGEVLLLRPEGDWIIHRVVKNEEKLLTKGDWSRCPDPEGSIWGKVVAVNGLPSFAVDDVKISRYSANISNQHPWRRRLNRFKMLFYVSLRKLFFKNKKSRSSQ